MEIPVATLNGVKVFSNKAVSGINNTRISFTDGSWCDVATGQVVNNGAGYISVGIASEIACSEKISEIKKFTASIIDLRNLISDIDIQPYSGKEIEIVVEGSKDDVGAITIYQNGNSVFVKGEGGKMSSSSIQIGNIRMSGRSIVTSNVRGSNISISGNSISVGGGKTTNTTKISFKVPQKTGVMINNIQGLTNIGDTEGSVWLGSNTGGDVNLGTVGDTTISIQGSTDVRAKHINGNLDISIQGSGDVKVVNGNVDTLNVSVQGSGDVRFGGKAVDASLTTMGSGDISVSHVQNKPFVSSLGSGDIKVGNW